MPPPPKKKLPKVIVPDAKPLWAGPCADGPLGGVTFSMLSKWLSCRERARVRYVLGLSGADQFNHRIEYGSGWHAGEEAFTAGKPWQEGVMAYYAGLYEKYPTQRAQVEHWYNVTLAQFPHYVEYWSSHPDVVKRTPLLQEQVFDVPYKLPSGRTVRLRGKWDGVDLIDGGIYLAEHKTKGEIDEREVKRQLTYDLQTMLYIVTLTEKQNGPASSVNALLCPEGKPSVTPIRGVRYNVIRRPLSGGRHTIKKHEPTAKNPAGESDESFYARLSERIGGDPEFFFMRWTVAVSPEDVRRFRRECLDPILENVAHWYDVVSGACDPTEALYGVPPANYRMPFGAGGQVSEYGWQDVDEFLATGDRTGLRQRGSLFDELQ
jgi:hypothetical protein